MAKSKSKKTTPTSTMTAAWVDSVPITISDDDDDDNDDNEASAADKQPAATEPAQCDAGPPPSDAVVPRTSDATKPSASFTVGSSHEPSHATDTALSVNADAGTSSVRTLPAAAANISSAENTDNLTVDSHTAGSSDAEKTRSAAAVPPLYPDGMSSDSFFSVASKIFGLSQNDTRRPKLGNLVRPLSHYKFLKFFF